MNSSDFFRKPVVGDWRFDRLLWPIILQPYFAKSHTTIKTLTRRAQLLCDSPNSILDETRHLERVSQKNNYDSDFIKPNTHRNTEHDETTNNPTPVTTATTPYIRNFWDYSTDLTTLRHTTRIDQQQGQLKTNLTTDKERCTWNFTLRRHYSWIRVEPSCHPPTQKDRVWLWFTASIYAGQSMRERDWLIDLYLNKVVPISIHFFTRKPYKFKKYLSIV